MKKILWILLLVPLIFAGCGKNSSVDVLKEIQKKLEKSSGYQLEGVLDINNNDDVYHYDVVVDFQKEDHYKVSIVNQANDFQQIILKNDDGVFLLTPSLNKSFKFQSDWPYKNSQIYLLDAVLNDVSNDEKVTIENKNDKFIVKTKVNYPNNSKLSSQKIVFNKNYDLEKVTVYDLDDVVRMEFDVSSIQYSPKYDKEYFDLDSIIDSDDSENSEDNDDNDDESEKQTSSIEDVIYPLLLPTGTKLVEEERVAKDKGERVIMTYDGEKSFLLVEETLNVFNEFTVIPSSGEPFQLMDTIGVMTDNSLTWSSGNMEYYLVSDVMNKEELVDIAQSIVGITSFK